MTANKRIGTLRIAIVVHGKFHAFELARALIDRGHHVTLLTSYPKFILKRENIPSKNVKSFAVHGVLSKVSGRIKRLIGVELSERWIHQMFGNWSSRNIERDSWDLIFCWSGVSEEILLKTRNFKTRCILVRGSTHIRTQRCLLDEEEKRAGLRIDKPSDWMLAREEREYELADKIRVLSDFSYKSFLLNGVCADKLWLHPSSFPISRFKLKPETWIFKKKQALDNGPLRVLYVGHLSYRKGMADLKEVIQLLPQHRFVFRLVGEPLLETTPLFSKLSPNVEFCGPHPQRELPKFYEWADLFVFPTIEDGFPQVLAQAYISGLPILTTTNSSAPDFLKEGVTGWIFPIRRPDLFVEKLLWCDSHRMEITTMVTTIEREIGSKKFRTWDDAAREVDDFYEGLCH